MKRIAIFCSSNSGNNNIYKEQATLLGQTLAKHNIEVVYGGTKIGLMGAVADGALSEGGKVIGVLPHLLKMKEIEHEHLTELIFVDSMHERKVKLNELCDGVIALPGGFGTMDELFEMLTLAQIGLHQKPIALLNTNDFYSPLIALVQAMVDNGFLKEVNQEMIIVSDNIDELISKMNNYIAPVEEKWIEKKPK